MYLLQYKLFLKELLIGLTLNLITVKSLGVDTYIAATVEGEWYLTLQTNVNLVFR